MWISYSEIQSHHYIYLVEDSSFDASLSYTLEPWHNNHTATFRNTDTNYLCGASGMVGNLGTWEKQNFQRPANVIKLRHRTSKKNHE